MEISGIRSALPFAFPTLDKDGAEAAPAPVGDMVDIHAPTLLDDSEVDGVLDDTLSMIAQDNVAALSVHGGLSESRVFALLGM
ncbi:MAG: hypothetical protein HDR50_07205 [Desulfovibrio sp.]|uniref:hypothetical protein n=1 Tax=Desulfovibrio sp. TaxID=885 RepID=UPI001A67FC0E|nr:hypothetical protein [Desulfovibrio sp.]MBD5417436.1 hypothetical protein [Desulfovibrio sp.]MDE6734285.1 hypothetical protein [Desulfovibrio sp.]